MKVDPRDLSARNFRYLPNDVLVPSGDMSRLRANIRALQLLRYLEWEDRNATPSEKKILAGYSGWGALKEVFNEVQAKSRTLGEYFHDQHYKSWEAKWGRAHDEVRAMMEDSEWRDASISVLNAHYTDPTVVNGIWQIADRLGFSGGPILEPAVGTGNFLGLMPDSIAKTSTIHATELDELTAKIAQKLYPQAKIRNQGFESSSIPNGSIALAISNVPFEQTGPRDKSMPMAFNLHNYFFAKTIDKLAPGGIMLYVTSAYTMDAYAPDQAKQRRYIAERTELIGAIRLPNNAFAANAGTEVVTDIVMLRKPDGRKIGDFNPESWHRTVEIGVGNRTTRINEYYSRHPEMVLGQHALTGTMYSSESYTVEPLKDAGSLSQQMLRAIEKLPSGICSTAIATVDLGAEKVKASSDAKEFAFVMHEGAIHQVTNGHLERVERLTSDQKRSGEAFIQLKETYNKLLRAELSGSDDHELDRLRQQLNDHYDEFVADHGRLQDPKTKIKHLADDPEFERVRSLERVKISEDEEGSVQREYGKADVFSRRTVSPAIEPTSAESLDDAITISLAWRGRIEPTYVRHLLGQHQSAVETIEEAILATGRAYREPKSGQIVTKDLYLSGNVRKKLDEAVAAAEDDPNRYERNVEALQHAQPQWVSLENVSAKLGAAWIPDSIVQAFAREALGAPYIRVRYNPLADGWSVDGSSNSAENLSTYGTERLSGSAILERLLNLKDLTIFDQVEGGKDGKSTVRVLNAVQTELVRQKVEILQRAFREYTMTRESVREDLEWTYNQMFNCYKPAQYDGSHLAMPGLGEAVRRNDHQLGAVWRIVQERQGIIAHGVGYGKTYTGIMTAMELRRLGIARKPMLVVDNATIKQFAESFRIAYPAANILVSTEETFATSKRQRFLASIASGDWDAVIVAQSQFDLLQSSPEAVADYITDQIEDLREAELWARQNGDRISQRNSARATKNLEAKLEALQERIADRQDNSIYFDELGVDFLLVDECHKYKKVPFVTKMDRVKGLDTQPSDRAMQLFIKLKTIQDKNQGRNTAGMSGTPVTNALHEAWQMTRLFAPNVVKEFHIGTVDQFVGTFCEKVTGLELNEATNKFKVETRLAKYVNGPEFLRMIRSCWDVQMDAEKVGLNVPKLIGGQIQQAIVPQTPQSAHISAYMERVYRAYEKSTNKAELSYVPIMLMQAGMAASIDPRLIFPDTGDHPNSLVNTMVENVVRKWHDSSAIKGTQLIFADRYRPMNISALGGKPVSIVTDEDEEADNDQDNKQQSPQFNLYREIVSKLVEKGIPPEEIAIVHDYEKSAAKKELFDQVNKGQKRILIGSTTKMGVGVNVQRRLCVAHELDAPMDMTPASMTQRRGRILRQGNLNSEVAIYQYGMEKTVAAGIYDRIARKEKFITQLLTSEGCSREFDDPASALSISNAEMKAKIIGDDRVVRQVELTEAIRQLQVEREGHYAQRAAMERQIKSAIASAEYAAARMADNERYGVQIAEKVNGKDWQLNYPSKAGVKASTDKKAITEALDGMLQELEAVERWESGKAVMRRFTINEIPCLITRIENLGERSYRFNLELLDPESPDRKVMRETEVKSGDGVLRILAASADVCDRAATKYGAQLSAERQRESKVREQLGATPVQFGKLDALSKLQAELDGINAALLAEGKAKEEPEQSPVPVRDENSGIAEEAETPALGEEGMQGSQLDRVLPRL